MESSDSRIKKGSEMTAAARWLIIEDILSDNPHISNSELRQEFFRRFYGNDFSPEERERIAEHLGAATTKETPDMRD